MSNELTRNRKHILSSAVELAQATDASAVVLIAEKALDFERIRQEAPGIRFIVASDEQPVVEAAKKADVDTVSIPNEAQTRQFQVTQVLLEAIADELLQTGDDVIVVYSAFEKDALDTVTVVRLAEQLSKLTSRDLQRLETKVPLDTLRIVVDLACEIGREGREGKPVGTLFVVGNHRKVMESSSPTIHDPFRGYPKTERALRDARVRESLKELAQIDGAFVISSDGLAVAAGRHLSATAEGLTLSKGLGSRHWAAAEISKATGAIAIAVSESTGTVRVFQDGIIVLRIEPMRNAMKWHDVSADGHD
jgi:DNA integrity scanning protein DisA with diadenylate cyclase activity